MTPNLVEYKNFFTRQEMASVLRVLFDRKNLWERRQDRVKSYTNFTWYTLGAPIYLDTINALEYPGDYTTKVEYFNGILNDYFSTFLDDFIFRLQAGLAGPCRLLRERIPVASLPGFHIFEGCEAGEQFFGKPHHDRQFEALQYFPLFQKSFGLGPIQNPRSYTLVLMKPYLGAHLVGDMPIEYEEGTLYAHSGLFSHAIGPFRRPCLPTDMRISLQAHSFEHEGVTYVYW
jgi:hypothetical protein